MFSANVSTRITFNFIYWVFSEFLRHERQVETEVEDAKSEAKNKHKNAYFLMYTLL